MTIRSTPSARMNSSAARRSAGRSPLITTWASSMPSSASRSASHGPLRSRTRPVSTSVPVTTMPARTLRGSPGRRAPAGRAAWLAESGCVPRARDRSSRAGPRSPGRRRSLPFTQVTAAVADRDLEARRPERSLALRRRSGPCGRRSASVPVASTRQTQTSLAGPRRGTTLPPAARLPAAPPVRSAGRAGGAGGRLSGAGRRPGGSARPSLASSLPVSPSTKQEPERSPQRRSPRRAPRTAARATAARDAVAWVGEKAGSSSSSGCSKRARYSSTSMCASRPRNSA